jgi:hypothetical protein
VIARADLRPKEKPDPKKNPALAHGALLPTALGFQRLAVGDGSNLRLKLQKATAPQ